MEGNTLNFKDTDFHFSVSYHDALLSLLQYLPIEDLGHAFHFISYEITISYGDPIHAPGFLKYNCCSKI